MGWREMIARRRRKEEVEDARYPPRMRTAGYGRDDGSSWLLVGAPAVILPWIGYQLWMEREYVWFGAVCATVLLAAGFAWFNMRNHRSRTAKQLREESEAESEADRVRWED